MTIQNIPRELPDVDDVIPDRLSVQGRELPIATVKFRTDGHRDADIAAIYGTPQNGSLVRVHSRCMLSEVLHSLECDCGWQLRRSVELLTVQGGVLIYLDQDGRGAGAQRKAAAYRLMHEEGLDTYEAHTKLGLPPDLRDYSAVPEVLKSLGLSSIRLLTNNPEKIEALQLGGIRVVRVPLIAKPTPTTIAYLMSKKRHGHLL